MGFSSRASCVYFLFIIFAINAIKMLIPVEFTCSVPLVLGAQGSDSAAAAYWVYSKVSTFCIPPPASPTPTQVPLWEPSVCSL